MRVLAAASPYSNAGPRLTPAPARFTTIVGRSYTIALQYPTGKPTVSRKDGKTQMMYTLTTGERAWFDMPVAEAIDSLTLAPGQPFTICNRGGGSWDIERVAPEYNPPQAPLPAQRPPTPPPNYPLPPASSHSATAVNGAGDDHAAILRRSYSQAIDITLAALEMALTKGLHFAPTHEAIQACAATLFIAETRKQQ
jgi:hypothetical protein